MSRVCKIQGINFGYAASERELSETPELFDTAFVDPRNYLSKLMDGAPFLVLGRKGSGKTAYSAKIQRLAMVNPEIVVRPSLLSDLNYSTFETFAENNVQGGRRFLSVWKYLLLLEIIKLIDETFPNHENPEMSAFIHSLKEYGFLPDEDIVHMAKHLDTTNVSLSLPNIITIQRGIEKNAIISGTDEIAEIGLRILKNSYYGDKQFFVILDGLDDALRGVHFSSDIITGLIRAAERINAYLSHSTVHIKVIVLLRNDIFELCRDPDITKIRRGLTINLSWTKDDLRNIVLKRIQNEYPNYHKFEDFWKDFAPERFWRTSSEAILFQLTLLRPRDILQFFIECQDLFGTRGKISSTDFSAVIARYSHDYFLSEMQDEITGILPDHIVTALPSILSEMGKRIFLEAELQQRLTENGINDTPARKLLETLYQLGYIGQLRVRDGRSPTYSFIHINPHDKYSKNDKCIIHRGLVKALNIT